MIATTLLANGAKVYIIGLDQKQVDAVVNIYDKAVGGRLVGLAGDVTKKVQQLCPSFCTLLMLLVKDEAKRLADQLAKREGYINVLFNNAGVVRSNSRCSASGSLKDVDQLGDPLASLKTSTNVDEYVKAFDTYSESDFHAVSSVNTFALYFMAAAFLKLLDASKSHPKGNKFPPQIIITSSMNAWSKIRPLRSLPPPSCD